MSLWKKIVTRRDKKVQCLEVRVFNGKFILELTEFDSMYERFQTFYQESKIDITLEELISIKQFIQECIDSGEIK